MRLRAMNRIAPLVAGCNTKACVLAITVGGCNRGFRTVLIAKCGLGLRQLMRRALE